MLIKTKTKNDEQGSSLEINSGTIGLIKPVNQKNGITFQLEIYFFQHPPV